MISDDITFKCTILTPTYNRKNKIDNLFQSLKNQTDKNFQWLVIDDGSSDDTESYIQAISVQSPIFIEYHKKKNGGKHTAINFGMQYVKSPVVAIVDSDDIIDAVTIETIASYWQKYKNNTSLCGFSFLKGGANYKTKPYIKDEFIGNAFQIMAFRNGGFEVFRTDILRQYPFPEFKGEKYVPESYMIGKIAEKYDTVYINKVLYYPTFYNDGLTSAGRKLRMRSPQGDFETALIYLSDNSPLKIRMKNSILLVVYGLKMKMTIKEIVKKSNHTVLLCLAVIPGMILYSKWNTIGG